MEIKDPCIPRELLPEAALPRVYGVNQPEYQDLPLILTSVEINGKYAVQTITRWALTDAERAAIVRGEDIFVTIINGGVVNPMKVQVGLGGWK